MPREVEARLCAMHRAACNENRLSSELDNFEVRWEFWTRSGRRTSGWPSGRCASYDFAILTGFAPILDLEKSSGVTRN
jgi:hypothetical protein